MKQFLKYLLIALAILCAPIKAEAQVLSVTATITDSDTTVWANCKISAVLNSPNGAPFYLGNPVSTGIVNGTCSGSGVIAISLNNTNTITPTGAQYQVTICSNTSATCSSFLTSITAANQTTNFSSHVVAPRFSALPGAFGYADVEVAAKTIGQGYYNVTTPGYEICNGTACAAVGGSSFNPAVPGPIGGTTPAPITGTTITATSGFYIPEGANSNQGFCANDADTCLQVFGGNLLMRVFGSEYQYITSNSTQLAGGYPQCWDPGAPFANNPDVCFSRLASGAMGVGVSQGSITGTIQSGVTATDPGCTTTANIGKQWFNITTTTTVYQVCLNVAGTVGWVVK